MASGASTCRRRTTARRQALKPRHLGSGRKVEKFRALFAGLDLHEAAVKAAGLDNTDIAGEPVAKLAKQHAIPVVDTSYRFTMADPRRANGDFRHGGMRDTACFEGLLDRVEHGVPRMEVQANAWATGTACAEAFGGADFARQQGLTDLRQRRADAWHAAAVAALAKNATTFALLPVDEMFAGDGLLARLKTDGYRIESPGEVGAGSDLAPASSTPASPGGSTMTVG